SLRSRFGRSAETDPITASICFAASRNSHPFLFITNAMPSPAPHLEQIHVPRPSLLSQRQRSLPPHSGHGPTLPERNDSVMPSAGRIPNQRPLARSLSGSLLSMTVLALCPCDLTGFDP